MLAAALYMLKTFLNFVISLTVLVNVMVYFKNTIFSFHLIACNIKASG